MRRALVLGLVGACMHARGAPTMTWPAIDGQLLADSAATMNFRLGTPAVLAVTVDGAVLFRRTPTRAFAADLFELDTQTGAVKVLFAADAGEEHLSDAEKARRERMRTATRGVVDIDVSQNGRTVMVPLGGVFHLVDRGGGPTRVVDPKGAAYDPHLSPTGTMIAFVRDGDLWVVDARPGATPRQITKHPEGFEYGVADFAAQEELDRRRGFWWLESDVIEFQRTDLRPIDTLYVADARHNDKPPVPFQYPRAGRANAIVDLGSVDVHGGQPHFSPKAPGLEYLARVDAAHGLSVWLTRDQKKLVVEPGSLIEQSDTWINVARPGAIGYQAGTPLWLPDGSWLWTTEARGAWTLEHRDHDGKNPRPITTPEFGLRALVGYDEARREAIVEASTDPTKQDVWRVPLDGGAPTRITNGDGISGASYDHGVLIIGTAFHAGGKRSVAINAAGKAFEIPSVAEQPKLVPTTVIETVELGGRTHYVAITRPHSFDAAKKYPVILEVYGGPHAKMVNDARDGFVMDQFYADAGFIVVRSDGRGTPDRGTAWERAIYKDLITVPMEDQVAALQAMGARHRELDLARVGVTGWSFGGYFSTMAVLLRPDVFKCAVAGAPVTDWALYDTAYTERYMRTPAENPEGYKSTSALTHADKLSRPLLVIHGITDDNVHFAHTLALIEALYVAGKYASVITLSATHMVPDPKLALAREQVQIDFFRAHLGPPP